jgi:hypothetical protein
MTPYEHKYHAGMLVLLLDGKIMELNESDADEENRTGFIRDGAAQPVKPYLVCDDEPMDGDLCFHKDGWNPVEYRSGWDKKWFTKIIAKPEEIALVYVKNKLGTRGLDDFYVTDITADQINDILNDGKCEIEWEYKEEEDAPEMDYANEGKSYILPEINRPKLKDGKVIIHI